MSVCRLLQRSALLTLVLLLSSVACNGDDDENGAAQHLVNQVYLLDLVNGGFEADDVESLIISMWPDDRGTLFTATEIDESAGTLEFMIGSAHADDPEADPIVWQQGDLPTIEVPATWNGDAFSFEGGPVDLEFDLDGAESMMWNFVFRGTYDADGGQVTNAYLEGMVDLVPWDEYLGLEPGDICESLATVTTGSCVDCPPQAPNQGPYCVFMDTENGTCPLMDSLTMSEVP